MELLTPRLRIRDPRLSDEERMAALGNSDFVRRYLCMPYLSPAEWHSYLCSMIEKQNNFIVALRESDEFIGKISLQKDDLRYQVNSTGLAYWIGEPWARRGYMTEAMRALLPWLFNVLGYEIITVRAFAVNTASRALMEKLGFTQEGYFRRAVGFEGRVYDDVAFSLLREDWRSRAESNEKGENR